MNLIKYMTNKEFDRYQKLMRYFRLIFGCHQLRERSFIINGKQLPLCSRCLGVYGGLLLSIPIALFYPLNFHVAILLMLFMIIDGETQFLGLRESNNYIRLFTGLFFSYGLVSIVVIIMKLKI